MGEQVIRKMQTGDIDQVMEIWLSQNKSAHGFIPGEYWESYVPQVREQILEADVYVYAEESGIAGFVGIVESKNHACTGDVLEIENHACAGDALEIENHACTGDALEIENDACTGGALERASETEPETARDGYIAGIFVEQSRCSCGIGKQLLDDVKSRYAKLTLQVYQKNNRALAFYLREGFTVISEGLDEETGEKEFTMCYESEKVNLHAPHDVCYREPDRDVRYRKLKKDELSGDFFFHFQRRQIVTKVWRKVDGKWIVKEEPFVDDWAEHEQEELAENLKRVIERGGFVYGAFFGQECKGFTAVDADFIGSRGQYLDLLELHVSQEMRRQGIGRKLFCAAKRFAKDRGAKSLYLSAHSAVESQDFYRAMGCVEAQEYQEKHVVKEPFDCQMECALYR